MIDNYYRVKFFEEKRDNVFHLKYLSPLRLEAHLGGYRFTLSQDFTILFPYDTDTHQIIDPKDWRMRNHVYVELTAMQGFDTDLISSPRALWPIFPPIGKGIHGSVIHDLLYRYDVPSPDGYFTQTQSDWLFRYCLELTGASPARRYLMYTALRYVGHRTWKSYRR